MLVSNFVYPAWFEAAANLTVQFDHLKLIKKPFEVRPGGYCSVAQVGQWQQVFGPASPASATVQRRRGLLRGRRHRQRFLAELAAKTGCSCGE